MRDLEIEGRRKRRYRATTDSRHPFPIAPNLLMREFEVDTPNTAWVTDITYLPTVRGFIYLVAIMGWHSRKVLSWRLSNTLTADFCV